MVYLNRQRPRRQGGLALLLAIFTCVILAVLAVGIAGLVRVELLASRGSFDRLQARAIAQAGFNIARSMLMYQDDTPQVDGLNDTWAKISEDPPAEFGEGSYRVTVVDAGSRININTADVALLTKVFKDADLAQAIIDRRESIGKFYSLGDLLQVEGLTLEKLQPVEKWLTAESWERNVYYDGETEKPRVDINTAGEQELNALGSDQGWRRTAARILALRNSLPEQKFTSFKDLLGAQISRAQIIALLDRISLSDGEYVSGKININTAPQEVLEMLPGATTEFVETVLAKRQQETDNTYSSPRAVMALLAKASDDDFFALCDLVSTKSAGFIIESEGDLKERPEHCILQGIVVRRNGPIAPVSSGTRQLPQAMFLAENNNP
jgi:DNA uptake protein ComE-like DNA-binding protein